MFVNMKCIVIEHEILNMNHGSGKMECCRWNLECGLGNTDCEIRICDLSVVAILSFCFGLCPHIIVENQGPCRELVAKISRCASSSGNASSASTSPRQSRRGTSATSEARLALPPRERLKARSHNVPAQFQKLASEARNFGDIPTLLLQVAFLSADAVGNLFNMETLCQFAEALALLFGAGRLHLMHSELRGPFKVLGVEYFYAEASWLLEDTACLPVIKWASWLVREFSDSSVADVPTSEVPGASKILESVFRRTGAFLSIAAVGSAWLCSFSTG